MWAIIGGLIGFLQSLAPELLKFQQDRRDKAHELAIMQLQLQAQKDGYNAQLEEIRVQGQSAEAVAIQSSYRSELKYAGKYSATVRPTVTYMAMTLYVLQKVLLICSILFAPTLPWLSHTWVTSSRTARSDGAVS